MTNTPKSEEKSSLPAIRKSKKRNFVGWDASGPVASMIANAIKGKQRGFKTDLFERMVAEKLGPQQPKLYERWLLLQKAAAITK